jgi:hypothetical protein
MLERQMQMHNKTVKALNVFFSGQEEITSEIHAVMCLTQDFTG